MRGTSRASLDQVERGFLPVLVAAGTDALGLGRGLFAVVDALDSSPQLTRALADPSVLPEAKTRLAQRLLADADERIVAVVTDLVRRRWSADADLAEAVERVARQAVLASADADGRLDRLEEEIFVLSRAMIGQREARRVLADPSVPPQARAGLVDGILAGRAAAQTQLLATRAASAPRGHRFVAILGHLSDLIAQWRDRQVATVTAASALTAAQRERLGELLARLLGRRVELNVIVDPRVVGGLRVQSGADVIDATVLARLADARRRLAV